MFLRIYNHKSSMQEAGDCRSRILIIGAGNAGEMLLSEILDRHSRSYQVVGFIDDDLRKYRLHILGVPVLGTRFNIPDIVNKKNIREIIIAIPSLRVSQMRGIIELCQKSGAEYRIVSGVSDFVCRAHRDRQKVVTPEYASANTAQGRS